MQNVELKDTVPMMNDPDYRVRFKAEYYQTKIRYEKLKSLNNKIEAAYLTQHSPCKKIIDVPAHDCPYDLLMRQMRIMDDYVRTLELRAIIEGIEL